MPQCAKPDRCHDDPLLQARPKTPTPVSVGDDLAYVSSTATRLYRPPKADDARTASLASAHFPKGGVPATGSSPPLQRRLSSTISRAI